MIDILSIKNGFMEANDEHLRNSLLINQKYNLQELRKQCKNWQFPVRQNYYDFTNLGVYWTLDKIL